MGLDDPAFETRPGPVDSKYSEGSRTRTESEVSYQKPKPQMKNKKSSLCTTYDEKS